MTILLDRMIEHGLDAFLAEAECGYPEARHVMAFPRAQGFMVDMDEQSGDIFQRACMAEVLVEIGDRTGRNVDALIAREVDYLLSMQRPYAPGGWSYFPQLHELPPDADDLAAVIRSLVAAGRRDAAVTHCTEPLRVLLEECVTGPGRFETWIVPRAGTDVHERQRWWIANAWGRGADWEVVANIVCALRQLDPARYATTIAQCVKQLCAAQDEDGLWPCSWYHGSFYAGWVCSTALGPEAVETARWQDWLRRNQRDDGGWSWGDDSDPLSTAFAVLALPNGDAAARRGRRFLEQTQEEDGLWRAVPWIRMELGRAEGRVRVVLSYGSRVIGSGYALQALLRGQEV